jgi:hypothetical protein
MFSFLAALVLFATASSEAKIDTNLRLIQLGNPGGAREVSFTLAQPDEELGPVPMTVTIADKSAGAHWSVELPAQAATRPWRVRVQPGTYELLFRAAHHRSIAETVTLSATDVSLGTRALRRHPVISGVVQTTDGTPLAAALVTGSEKLSTLTDALGRFTLELEAGWPARLEVSYGGLAKRLVDVPRSVRSVTLPPVTLTPGGTLRLATNITDTSLAIDVVKEEDVVFTTKMSVSPLEVENLEAGEYVLVLRGGGPLERLSSVVRIKAGETTEENVEIEPLNVQFQVVRGESGVAGARIQVRPLKGGWNAAIVAGDEGKVSLDAWQRGNYIVTVSTNSDSPPLPFMERIDGVDRASVRLEVPDRILRGRVLDAATGSPIANATIAIDSVLDDGTEASLPLRSSVAGTFLLDAVRPGVHTVRASADEYLASDKVALTVNEADKVRELTVRLRRGAPRTVRVVSPRGLPIRGAAVIHAADGQIQSVGATDDRGEANVLAARKTATVVYIVPREGSLGIGRIDAARNDSPLTIVVPDPIASLELRAADAEGRPIRDVRFLMRIDGELIPPDVQYEIHRLRGDPPVTGADGALTLESLPIGFFELWPLRTDGEMHDILVSLTESAPVELVLKPGRNTASLTFERR